jgi:hypothetical protein
MSIKRIIVCIVLASVAITIIVGLNYLVIPFRSLLWNELSDFGHFPLFAVVALALFGIIVNLPGTRQRRRQTQYLLAFAAVLVAGALSEFSQVTGPRDADAWDLARNVSGSLVALMILATFDSRMTGSGAWKKPAFRNGLRAAAIILLLANFAPVAIRAEAYRQRAARMPVLHSFDSPWELIFMDAYGATIELVPPPKDWVDNDNRLVGKLTFHPGRFPGVNFREPYPDWSPYRYLDLKLYSEQDEDVDVVIRIDDMHSDYVYEDRFNKQMTLGPGWNSLRISLEEVRSDPKERELDMTAIARVILFVVRPEEPISLYLVDMKLEP